MRACRILSLLVKSKNTFTFIVVPDYLQVFSKISCRVSAKVFARLLCVYHGLLPLNSSCL